jgi:tetratricopeptide (TPR) repeat protein
MIQLNKYILIFIVLVSVKPSFGQLENLSWQQDKIESFARDLMKEGEYYRAITEYKRLISYIPDRKKHLAYYRSIANCYELGGLLVEANNTYQKILQYDTMDWNAHYNITRNYTLQRRYYASNDQINAIINQFSESRQDTLRLMSIINDTYLEEYNRAQESLNLLSAHPFAARKKIEFKEIFDNDHPLPIKNKTTGALLAITIPGAGYAYAEKYETALAAFLVNGLFAYFTYKNFADGNDGVGYLSGLFGLGFYVGSIYGSLESIDKINTTIKLNFSTKFTL